MYLYGDGGVAAEHELQAADVAFGPVRHKDLARRDASIAIERPRDGFPQLRPPLLCAVPATSSLCRGDKAEQQQTNSRKSNVVAPLKIEQLNRAAQWEMGPGGQAGVVAKVWMDI